MWQSITYTGLRSTLKRRDSETLEDVEAGRYHTLTTISLKPATTLKNMTCRWPAATTLKT